MSTDVNPTSNNKNLNLNPNERDLDKISDKELIERIKHLTKRERVLNTWILKHLWEVSRRRLYSDLGHRSIFDFTVKVLKYSEREAWPKINGMTFLKNMPDCEQKIHQGSLNISNISMLDRFFKNSGIHSRKEKEEIINKVENRSSSECEQILSSESESIGQINPFKKTVVRRADSENHRLHVCIKDESLRKMQIIQGYLAHQGHQDMNKILEYIIEIVFDLFNKAKTKQKKSNKSKIKGQGIPSTLRREVWQRANGKCEKCGSFYALEIDHCLPQAKGGTNEIENLRLLCRSCNQREAIKQYGQHKMDKYLLKV